MGSGEAPESSPSSPEDFDAVISELHEKHRIELEKLTLTRHPFKTLSLFLFSTVQYFRQSLLYLLSRGGWVTGFSILSVAFGFLIVNVGESYEQLVQEFLHYFSFGLWWVALGIASSIGLGSGLHTFVLYLGPHIALFTVKAMACGRVDIKSAPYDTIQLRRGPSWLEKDCSEFGTPLYHLLPGSLVRVPVSRVLPKVQLEAILWGLGTALGELPPYFISRAARLSGSKLDTMEDLGVASSEEDGFGSAFLKRIQQWLLSHAQHLNFFTILLLASVPNPLFDLAGIMCGQFGIPFWKFFLATLIGKAIIKTYIQTVFIISLCNNQLLEWVENELICVVGLIPGISSVLPNMIAKLHKLQKKYFLNRSPAFHIDDDKAKTWNLSLIWNTVVWLMLLNFVCKIVTSVAQQYLREQQDLELKDRQTSLRPRAR